MQRLASWGKFLQVMTPSDSSRPRGLTRAQRHTKADLSPQNSIEEDGIYGQRKHKLAK